MLHFRLEFLYEIDEMLQDQCKYERNQAYNLLDDLKAAYFYENESEIFHELRRIKSPLKGLIDLTREFMIRYDEKKKNENIMDFDDMEHFALELLTEDLSCNIFMVILLFDLM